MALDGAAQRLLMLGHDVVVHGRDQQRAQEALRGVPGAGLRWQVISLASNKPVLSRIRPTPPDRSRPSFTTRGSFVRTPRVVRRSTDSKTRCSQFSRPIPADRAHRKSATIGLFVVRNAPNGSTGSERPAVTSALERISGVRQLETICCRARIRCRTALVSGPVERGQSGVAPTKMGGPQAPDDLGLGCRDAGLVGG